MFLKLNCTPCRIKFLIVQREHVEDVSLKKTSSHLTRTPDRDEGQTGQRWLRPWRFAWVLHLHLLGAGKVLPGRCLWMSRHKISAEVSLCHGSAFCLSWGWKSGEAFAYEVERRSEAEEEMVRQLRCIPTIPTPPGFKPFKLKVILLKEKCLQKEQLDLIDQVPKLRLMQGEIHVFKLQFPCEAVRKPLVSEHHQLILKEYADHIRRTSVWPIPWELPNRAEDALFARSVVCCAAHFERETRLLHLVSVYNEEYRNWAYPGGDILPNLDGSLANAAKREFLEDLRVELS